jgi:hypothetical protein
MVASPWLDLTDDDDLALIVAVWPDAPTDDTEEATLGLYLGAAQQQCLDFLDLPEPEEDEEEEPAPDNWRLALIMQTRALWQASRVNEQDQIGLDGQQVTVYPMDWTVKNLLKPRSSKVRVR